MKDTIRRFIPLLIILALMAAVMIPKKLEERAANAFGEPLFSHALPENAKLLQQDAAKDEEGGTTAALLLETELSVEELEEFYSDTVYVPAEEGQTVTLQAKELDEGSISALKQAELYTEGAQYRFVYLYSKP